MDQWWTNREVEIIRKIWSSTESIESQMHLLPNRSLKAAKNKARALGLVKAVVERELMRDKALDLLEFYGPMSADRLMALIHRSRQNADSIIRQLYDENRIHIHGYDVLMRAKKSRMVKVWAAGEGKNANAPRKRQKVEIAEVRQAITVSQPFRDPFIEAFFGAAA
ncbi:hypothetical protein BGLT_05204 [Caballeronia glathei]|uniref:Uncharacterized protein n=1 Tax=Caballeronia glathei TaxID=60547 RepID=A0A069PEZ3_9BURK|nr:hypothetical protein [Caballeronia glathei]KDR39218.1 hypothetical protein BG61_34310 [Caballeronia glathei]CDY76132.1 hypothetical protein BGLT_05204 [Caballeronia glathei]